MENASKALIMVGGVLISVMLASFMIFVLRKGGMMNAQYDSQKAGDQLVKFNSQFEVYAKDNNTFFDIITVANLAYDVNQKNNWDAQNSVTIYVCKSNQNSVTYSILPNQDLKKNYFFNGATADVNNQKYMYDLITGYAPKKDELEEGKENPEYRYKFDCVKTDYNEITGKVKEMKFLKVENN